MNYMNLVRCCVLSFLCASSSLIAFDNPHFYRATNMFPEPRLGRDWLGSIDMWLEGGRTKKGINQCHQEVPILDIYGTHNMQELGINVPNKDITNPLDLLLIELALIPASKNFATFSIDSTFTFFEAHVSWTQNFSYGFFTQIDVPVRRLCIKDICFKDLTPVNSVCPNVHNPEWQAFLSNFDAILARYCLSKEPVCETHLGDVSAYIGWTYNYQETEVLDFVDATIRIGVIAPTSPFQNQDLVFALPTGYNGNLGVPVSAQFAFGACDWITFGAHIGAIVFADTTKVIRMKTALYQSGLFKLAKGCASIDRGSIWHAGLYAKADHFIGGLSLLFGYSFVNQNKTTLIPEDCTIFNTTIVNSDESLRGWKMHTIHTALEYDFTQQDARAGVRASVFYNAVVGGKRIFKTYNAGATIGLDIVCDF